MADKQKQKLYSATSKEHRYWNRFLCLFIYFG